MLYTETNMIFTPLIINFIIYWGICLFWFICDLYVDPKYRIPGKINWELYRNGAIYTLVSQLVLTPPVLYLLLPLWKWRAISLIYEDMFTIGAFKIFLCPFISEIIFFYTHKLGHTRSLYKAFHSVHHQWIVPCAVSASHAHPLEYLLCNLPTLLVPPLILGLNWYVANLWFVIANVSIVNSHSGYMFEDSIRHAAHHKYYNINYGPMKILDNIYNTEKIKL